MPNYQKLNFRIKRIEKQFLNFIFRILEEVIER